MRNSNIFDYAYLSVASYADLSKALALVADERADATREAIEIYSKYSPDSDKTSKFAELVTNNYEAIGHWQDRGKFWDVNNFIPFAESNKNRSGFSATLFKNKKNHEYILAFKGTAGGKDLIISDGGDVVLDGIAHEQVMDLYNFWIQMHTPEGETYEAAYFRKLTLNDLLDENLDKVIKLDGKYYIIDFKNSLELYAPDSGYTHGLNVLKSGDKVSITGHSLGGHLAIVFAHIFPDAVQDAYVFNGAGLGRNTSLLALGSESNYQKIFNSLSEKQGNDAGQKNIVTNIIGDKAIDFVANNWPIGLQQPINRFESFIEEAISFSNVWGHGMDQMAETMAVASIFSSLDHRLNDLPIRDFFEEFLNPLLRSTAVIELKTLETILVKIHFLLTGNKFAIPTGDREAFYQAIIDLQTLIKENGLSGKLHITRADTDDIASFALQDNMQGLAARYALKYLNPSIALGERIYTAENIGAEAYSALQLYSYESLNGMTEDYIQQRSTMLNLRMQDADGLLTNKAYEYGFKDLASGIILNTFYVDNSYYDSPVTKNNPLVIFGTDAGESIVAEGGNNKHTDYLFGGAGDDELDGKAGNDYYEGGTGHDIYRIEGFDTLHDTDGDGKLSFHNYGPTGEIARLLMAA